MRLFERCERVLRYCERLGVGIAAAALFVIMLVVMADVVLRYFFNAPLSWSYELISLYLMVGLFFFALSDTLANNAHVSVDILHLYMPAGLRHAAEFIGYMLAIPVFAAILYTSAAATWQAYRGGDVLAGHIAWPTWLALLCVPLGSGVLLSRIIFRFFGHGASLLARRSVVALPPVSGQEESL